MFIIKGRKRFKKRDLEKTPGEVLKEAIIKEGINNSYVALITEMSDAHISNVVNNKANITPRFALKLEKVFPKIPAEYWLGLVMNFQLKILREAEKVSSPISQIFEEWL